MNALTSKQLADSRLLADSQPAPSPAVSSVPRLSPRVVCDLRILTEAAALGLIQLVIHVLYYNLVLNIEEQLRIYTAYTVLCSCLFFGFKRFVFGMQPQHLGKFSESFGRSSRALIATILTFVVLVFLTKAQEDVSRGWLLLWLVTGVIATAAFDGAMAHHLASEGNADRDLYLRRVALLGSGSLTLRAAGLLAEFDPRGTRLVATVDLEPGADAASLEQALTMIERLVERSRLDEIVLALPWSEHEEILRTVERLAHVPVDISLCPDQLGRELATLALHGSESPPFLPLVRHSITHWGEIAKRGLDLVGSGLALLFFSPLLLAIALAIRLDSPGPVFFRQSRHGLNHEVFKVWKFRTMRAQEEPADSFRQASADDDRITRIGGILRRTSLDELPQLLNVARGEMSLVGPRPHPVPLNLRFAERIRLYTARHRVRPGITGLAQINGYRGETDTDEKMAGRIHYDLDYIRNWTIWLDLKILMLTLVRGFIHPNAY